VSRNARCNFSGLVRLAFVVVAGLLGPAVDFAPAADQSPPSSRGPHARVVTVQDPEATDAFRPRLEHIKPMVGRALTNLTGKATCRAAWQSLIPTQAVIGIKVYSSPGQNSGTRPDVVAAVIESLTEAGWPSNHIIVWDREVSDLRLAGFFDLAERYGVRVAGSAQAGYDKDAFYDTPLLGNLVWGDLEFGRKGAGVGRKSFVSKLVSRDMTAIINITPLLNHNFTGVSGNLYSLSLGSVDNIVRFESDPERLATAVPEIYALTNLSDHVVLNIVDALICQYEGGDRGLLHYSAVLNQLRFSRDPVALDVLSIRELDTQRGTGRASRLKFSSDLYQNAAALELGVSDLKRIDVELLR
jgi:hypothetical protein